MPEVKTPDVAIVDAGYVVLMSEVYMLCEG
jgi:hypothetical protein